MKKAQVVFILFLLPFVTKGQLFVSNNTFSHADSLRGSITPLRSCYDIQYYHLDVKFNLDQQSISGSNLFRFTATHDFNKLQFDLFDNLTIQQISYHGMVIPYARESNAVFVTFPTQIKKGHKDEFTVYFSGKPPAIRKAPMQSGIVYAQDSLGNPLVATACESKGASIWWPNKDHLSDEVDSMLISISVPKGLMDVSNGRLRTVTDLPDGYTRFDWFVSNPINNYNVAANIGKYVHFEQSYPGESGNLTCDYWVLPYHLERARKDFAENVKPMLSTYEHWFGPYPFYSDGYKLVETPYPAMEHQSAISYGGYMQGGPKNELVGIAHGKKWDFVIVHESAHEWFGNSITAKDLADLWIHEAFATYAESLFIEGHYGKQAGQQYLFDHRLGISNDKPVVGPYNVNQLGSGDMYSKGAVLLNMIRTIINDDAKWLKILRGLNVTFYHQTVTYYQIVNYINVQSGMDLKAVFDQYFLRKELPVLQIKTVNGVLTARWRASDKDFDMPIVLKTGLGNATTLLVHSHPTPIRLNGITIENLSIDESNLYFVLDKSQH